MHAAGWRVKIAQNIRNIINGFNNNNDISTIIITNYLRDGRLKFIGKKNCGTSRPGIAMTPVAGTTPFARINNFIERGRMRFLYENNIKRAQNSKNCVPFGQVFKASYIKACYVKRLENTKKKKRVMFFAFGLLGLLA